MIAGHHAALQFRLPKNVFVLLLGIVWVFSVGFGFSKLYNYEYKFGTTGQLATQWPSDSVIAPRKNFFRLVMVAHPHCPCTKASIGELAMIMAKAQGKAEAYVLFIQPKEFDRSWVESDLFKSAAQIPGVQAIVDHDGVQAGLFGGTTSGQTFLYDQKGRLVFMGGITASRGHSGDNKGRANVIALVNGYKVDDHTTPFFGCLLKSGSKNQIARTKGN
ncbi:MAG: hypothetical protein KA403_06815 [Candidatus Omnitrophica bacterium]|nr:hypothetical protein [Candidatus Omnitrophota bacterium]